MPIHTTDSEKHHLTTVLLVSAIRDVSVVV